MDLKTDTGVFLSVARYNDLLEGEKGLWQTLEAHCKLIGALMKIAEGTPTLEEMRAVAADALQTDLREIDWTAWDEWQANVRLIAAAPDLLAALKELAEKAHNYFTVDESVWRAVAKAEPAAALAPKSEESNQIEHD